MSRAVVFAIAQAQVMWARLTLSIALLLRAASSSGCSSGSLSSLFWGALRTVFVYLLYGAVVAANSRVTQLGVFVVQGRASNVASGVEWSGPSGIGHGMAARAEHHSFHRAALGGPARPHAVLLNQQAQPVHVLLGDVQTARPDTRPGLDRFGHFANAGRGPRDDSDSGAELQSPLSYRAGAAAGAGGLSVVRSRPRCSRRIRTRIAHGIVTATRGRSWSPLATGPSSEVSGFRPERNGRYGTRFFSVVYTPTPAAVYSCVHNSRLD